MNQTNPQEMNNDYKRQSEEMAALMQTTEAISSTLELDVVLQIIADQARTLLRADGSRIHLLEPDGVTLRCVVANHDHAQEVMAMKISLGEGITGSVAQMGIPQLVNSRDPRALHVPGTSVEPESLALAPLRTQQGVIGVMTVSEIGLDDRFTQKDLDFLVTFARQASIAIERAWLFDRERNSRILAESLADVVMAINMPLELRDVLDRILEQTQRVIPCQATNVMLIEGEKGMVLLRRQYGYYEEHPPVVERSFDDVLPVEIPTLQYMIRNREPVLIGDVTLDPNWYFTEASAWIRSFVGAPLVVGDRTIGFLNVNSDQAGYFNEESKRQVQLFATHVALAIERSRLYSDLQRALEKEKSMRVQLIHSEKMAALGRLVASVSHEINNPLQALQNSLTLIEEAGTGKQAPEKIQRYTNIARGEISRISSIVQRLRDYYARPSNRTLEAQGYSGGADDAITGFFRSEENRQNQQDIPQLVQKVLDLLGSDLRDRRIVCEQVYEPDLPALPADGDQLKQVLLNLVLNAIEAMPEGGHLAIQAHRATNLDTERKNVPGVEIEISDTGMGIPKAILSQVFEPFFTTKEEGTGLGLFISYKLIESHRGRVAIESEENRGTKVRIFLPL